MSRTTAATVLLSACLTLLGCEPTPATSAADAAHDAAPGATEDAAPRPDPTDVPEPGPGPADATPTADSPDAPAPAFPDALDQLLATTLDDSVPETGALAAAQHVVLPSGLGASHATGDACTDPAEPLTAGHHQRVGSITKTFVAALVLQLVAEGDLALDVSAVLWVPGLDPTITLRHLLSHTSGLFDLTDDPLAFAGDLTEPVEPLDVVTMALGHGPLFAPGQAYSYSNTNYFVLGLVLEAVTEQPLGALLRARLLDPLELHDTALEGYEPVPEPRSCGHVFGFDATDAMDLSWSWAAGAMVSTPEELCRWVELLWRTDSVLPEDLRDQMLARTVLPDGTETAYGLGVRHAKRAGVPVVGHAGQTMGFTGEVYLQLDTGRCVALLTNEFDAKPSKAAGPAWNVLLDWDE